MTKIATVKISKDNSIVITKAFPYLSDYIGTIGPGDYVEIHAERENPLSVTATIILRPAAKYRENP